MNSRLLIPKLAVFLLALFVILFGWTANRNDQSDVAVESHAIAQKSNSSVVPAVASIAVAQPISEGVYLSGDKSRVSVNFAHMPRLLIIQRLAEVAGFSFSLPDDVIEYWQASLAVNIKDEPLQDALSKIIGAKSFNLEVAYDADSSTHKISALFLAGKTQVQTVQSKTESAPSPVPQTEPIPFERDIGEAPAAELAATNENRIKRDNFYTADTQTRVALLNEMSPVGEDLYFILTSLRKDEQVSVRITAAQRLSFSESYVATQSLLDSLSDKDEAVVKAAVNSLVALGDASVLPVIDAKFANHQSMQTVVQEAKNRIAAQYHLASDQQP